MVNLGPLQLVVIDFHSAVLPPLVHSQIDAMRRRGLMRLVDSIVVVKGRNDDLINLETLDAPRSDSTWNGVLARSLFGSKPHRNWQFDFASPGSIPDRRMHDLGVSEAQLLEIADLIPVNSRALILLVEHLWMAELNTAAKEAHGHVIANCWISPFLLSEVLQRGSPLFD
jgi:uncharacterized membrane protein